MIKMKIRNLLKFYEVQNLYDEIQTFVKFQLSFD